MALLRFMTVFWGSWVGFTKALFVSFIFKDIFDVMKVPVGFFDSHSYLADVSCGDTCQIRM